jgi:hypothetical protein
MEKLLPRMQQMQDKLFMDDLFKVMSDVYERIRSVALSSAGLVISATTTKVKTGANIFYYSVGGILSSIAAGTDMPVLVGTVTNAKFNVFVFTVDKAGNTYTTMGTEAGTLATVGWPKNLPANRTVIGFVIINPTGTGNFVGGTTALGDGTVVPNAVYISPLGAFDVNAPLQ